MPVWNEEPAAAAPNLGMHKRVHLRSIDLQHNERVMKHRKNK